MTAPDTVILVDAIASTNYKNIPEMNP